MKKNEFEILVSITGLSTFDAKTVKDTIDRVERTGVLTPADFLQLSYIFQGLNSSLVKVLRQDDWYNTIRRLNEGLVSSKILPLLFKEYLDTINPISDTTS